VSEQVDHCEFVDFAAGVGQNTEFGNLASQMSGKRPEVYLLDRQSHSIELDYRWQVVVLACFSCEVIPSSGDQSCAVMERIKDRRDFFCRQESFEKRLKSVVKLKKVLTFDPLKFSQLRHNQISG